MRGTACYEIIEITDKRIVLKDLGPWDQYMTITNAADSVIREINLEADISPGGIGNWRVFYYDSEGELTELLVKNGQFAGFAPAKESDIEGR